MCLATTKNSYQAFSYLLYQVRTSVLQMLPSAEIDDLPVVVKFIMQSVGDNDSFEVTLERF